MLSLSSEDYVADNIISEEKAIQIVQLLKKQGKKIGLVKGSFDLMHPGHVVHIEEGKKSCDVLFVAVAKDDYSINKNPESGRPIYSEWIRAYMVSKLKSVDYVILDNDEHDAIEFIKPDVCIRGTDHNDDNKPGTIKYKEILSEYGGELKFTNSVRPTTTEIIDHIKKEIKDGK